LQNFALERHSDHENAVTISACRPYSQSEKPAIAVIVHQIRTLLNLKTARRSGLRTTDAASTPRGIEYSFLLLQCHQSENALRNMQPIL